MGEIMLISMTSKTTSSMELRSLADWVIRPRLLGVPGVAQVMIIGGDTKQYQVLVDPAKLRDYGLTLKEVRDAVGGANVNASGGFMERPDLEYFVRARGRVNTLDDLANSVVAVRNTTPILVKNVADVRIGPAIKRGDGSFNMHSDVVATIQKQPNANTLEVTAQIEAALAGLKSTLPDDVTIDTKAFQQAVIMMTYFGISINTMTLGGLAIAIGELVDDAIIDVENVFRRLRQNAQSGMVQTPAAVIFKASSEIRSSIVFATLIIVLVFIPLLNLGGFEGRMFAPLAFAYIASVAASLLVALTVTPALCYYLLGRSRLVRETGDSKLVRWLKWIYVRILQWTLRRPVEIIGFSAVLLAVAIMLFPLMGHEFLPPFNEGALNINVSLPPGTSLQESNRIGRIVEDTLHRTPEVVSTTRRTGRAELDEHAAGVNASEIEVVTKQLDRPQAAIMEEVRQNLSQIPGITSEVGQPMSHRMDHLLSGTRAQIAIKLFGPDLVTLRNKAEDIRKVMETVPGVVDLMVEPQVGVPQLQINMDRKQAAAVGLRAENLAETVDTAFNGEAVSQVLENQRTFDLVVRFN